MQAVVMVPFSIPELIAYCHTIGACIVVEDADPKLADLARTLGDKVHLATFGEGDESRWIEIAIDDWDEKGTHFHIEIHRGDIDLDAIGRPFTECEFGKLKSLVGEFIELAGLGSEQFAVSQCELRVPQSELPQHGTIATLLAFERRSCDASFGLSGATLDIEDDFFDRLHFRLNPKDKQLVHVNLWASSFFTLDSEFLNELADLLEIGVDCFVFEQISREEASHA